MYPIVNLEWGGIWAEYPQYMCILYMICVTLIHLECNVSSVCVFHSDRYCDGIGSIGGVDVSSVYVHSAICDTSLV